MPQRNKLRSRAPVKRDHSITFRVSEEEFEDIKRAADKLWPHVSSFSLSAKVRELLRQRVVQVLSLKRPR